MKCVPRASRYQDVPWLHRHSENEAKTFICLNESAKKSMKEEKNRSFKFQTYSMKFQDSISNLN